MKTHWFALSTLIIIVIGIAIQRYTNIWHVVGLP
jgi:hypothetical protein